MKGGVNGGTQNFKVKYRVCSKCFCRLQQPSNTKKIHFSTNNYRHGSLRPVAAREHF